MVALVNTQFLSSWFETKPIELMKVLSSCFKVAYDVLRSPVHLKAKDVFSFAGNTDFILPSISILTEIKVFFSGAFQSRPLFRFKFSLRAQRFVK